MAFLAVSLSSSTLPTPLQAFTDVLSFLSARFYLFALLHRCSRRHMRRHLCEGKRVVVCILFTSCLPLHQPELFAVQLPARDSERERHQRSMHESWRRRGASPSLAHLSRLMLALIRRVSNELHRSSA